MRRLLLVLALVTLAVPACSSGDDAAVRTVLTDFNHDEFATSINGFFPRTVPVHPGDTIVFKQAWTGEAHTVTLGTMLKAAGDFIRPYMLGEKEIPPGGEEPPELLAATEAIPFFFGEKGVNQTAGQPCYLKDGPLPTDEKPCPRVPQPAFTGREAFYSSGFIPYEGNGGNKFEMKLADDIAPGEYFFYCLLHGAGMGGFLQVKPAATAIPSQGAVNRTARRQLEEAIDLLTKEHEDALDKSTWEFPPGTPPIDIRAGALGPENSLLFALADEFYPKKFTAKVGQKVTWSIFGHTVSFRVPKYGPQLRVDPKTHEVQLNQQAYEAVGVKVPDTDDASDAVTIIDAGNYDGSKFLSSGTQFNAAFSATFTKAGTYQYACTIHPRMVGTLVVQG